MAEGAPRIAAIFHFATFSIYAYTVYYSISYVNVPPPYPDYAFAGKAKYLTQWNLCLCGLYFGLCVVLNFLRSKSLYGLRDYIFCSVLLPSCIFVSFVFWSLYAIDRELIFPREIEPYYPSWVNHCSHTLITFTAVFELLINTHKVPSKRRGFTGILAWLGVYQIWILYLGIVRKVWVYPVMGVLPPSGLTVFFMGCCVVAALLHVCCNALLHCRNRMSATRIDEQKLD